MSLPAFLQIGYSSLVFSDLRLFKEKLLHWASHFSRFCFLDSNDTKDCWSRFDFIMGVDALATYSASEIPGLVFKDFLMGYFSYQAYSGHFVPNENLAWDEAFLFEPRYLIIGYKGRIYFNRNYPEMMSIYDQIQNVDMERSVLSPSRFQVNVSREDYRNSIYKILDRIRDGRFYELNYCIEFKAEEFKSSPLDTYIMINEGACAPMSTCLKDGNQWILSFSPERYICKRGVKLIAQPMKGTACRDNQNEKNDTRMKESLRNSRKERAENTMIADLLRNDLTHYATPGSIKVIEECEIKTYNTVHQMVSTIEAKLNKKEDGWIAFLKTLPAGSMTGAPKNEVVRNIEELESFHRGIYAGHIGYIDPNGDFDFNVVIRTLQLDTDRNLALLHVGSAITLLSNPEHEYEECLLKAEGILKYFSKSGI